MKSPQNFEEFLACIQRRRYVKKLIIELQGTKSLLMIKIRRFKLASTPVKDLEIQASGLADEIAACKKEVGLLNELGRYRSRFKAKIVDNQGNDVEFRIYANAITCLMNRNDKVIELINAGKLDVWDETACELNEANVQLTVARAGFYEK